VRTIEVACCLLAVQADKAFGQRHLYALGGKIDVAEIAFGEGDQDLVAGVGRAHDEESNGASGAVYFFNLTYQDRGRAGYIHQGAADQVSNVDFVVGEWSSLSEGNSDDEAAEGFGFRDGIGVGEVEDDSALVQPMGLELNFARSGIGFGARRLRVGDQPRLLAVGKSLGEIGEDVGEDFAFAALRAANAGQPSPFLRGDVGQASRLLPNRLLRGCRGCSGDGASC
jgi:hypothetical protein